MRVPFAPSGVFLLLVILVGVPLQSPTAVDAIPRRGNEPWSLILCKFGDLPNYEPRPRQWFEQWLHSKSDNDSIQNFFAQASNGVYTISGSAVYGWYTLPYTQKDVLRLVNAETAQPIGSDSSFDYFDKIKELCVELAIENGARLHRQKITVINAGTTAVYGKKHGVLLTPQLMFSSVLTHEMVHSFFIGHSYSDRKIRVFPYALNGEYDDRYDLMSTANAYMRRSRYGMSGPGLNGAHLDFLGWLPMDRILYFGRDGRQNYTLRLSSLSVAHNITRGWLLVMIPYDRDDPNNMYTLELRTPHTFDEGIVQPAVLIHRVQKVGESYYSVLLSQAHDFYELTENTEWVKFLQPNAEGHFQYIRITVKRVYANDADISVSSTFEPNECQMGELMHPVKSLNASQLNQVAAAARVSSSDAVVASAAAALALDGLEHVCTESVRPLTRHDVHRQFLRQNFFAVQRTFGANACRPGYVWRALDAYDYICVTPQRRENALAQLDEQVDRVVARLVVGNSAEVKMTGCVEPYLPRHAFPGDDVCVLPAEKFRTFRENIQSTHMLQHFAFFNGVDTVGP